MADTVKGDLSEDLSVEFPRLDLICRKVFDIPLSVATPNLRRHVELTAKRDAAGLMYELLLGTLPFMACSCTADCEIHSVACPKGKLIEVIRQAEGRA